MTLQQPENVLIVGAGAIAAVYAKVLRAKNLPVVAVGRGSSSADAFERNTGISVVRGGIERCVGESLVSGCTAAIVAVSGDQLAKTTDALLRGGIRRILLEKPGGADLDEIRHLAQSAASRGADIRVAYNRRCYASVIEAKQQIQKDGGPTSFLFEFTEWSHVIEPLEKPTIVKEQWFLHNSTHVVDLAFYLGGEPERLEGFVSGRLAWHRHARYAGAGLTVDGVPFSYHANWDGPGRWGVEVLTKHRRYILRPLEKLQQQNVGALEIVPVELNDALDQQYKPGFYKQVESFLEGGAVLPSISEVEERLKWYGIMNPPAG